MLDNIKLKKILEILIDKETITNKELISIPINNNEIEYLIKEGILERINFNEYKLLSLETLYNYGIELIKRQSYERAIKCLEKCSNINPKYQETQKALLYVYIQRKKFSKAFEIFEQLDTSEDIIVKKNNNFLLYLLSLVSNYPDKYINRVLRMDYDDILITTQDGIINNQSQNNKMRICIMQNKLRQAEKILLDYFYKNNAFSLDASILKVLINQAINTNKIRNDFLLYAAQNKNYRDIINKIETKKQKRKISLYEAYIYKISYAILRIKETRKIPKVTVTNTDSIKEAIKGNNYRLALVLHSKHLKEKNNPDEVNIVTILLKEINKLINQVITEYKESIEKEKENRQTSINNIMNLLKKDKIDLSIDLLKKYLSSIKSEEYLYLLIGLIEISILIKDNEFQNVYEILNNISFLETVFNIHESIIRKFHESISNNNIQLSEMYLEIIIKYQYLFKDKISDKKLSEYQDLLNQLKEEKNFLEELLSNLKSSNEYVYILKDISKQRKENILRMIKSIEGLTANLIGTKEPKLLVIRQRNQKDEEENSYEELLELGMTSYDKRDYDLAIKTYIKLITTTDYIKPKIYAMLGLSYLHIGNTEKALKYLNIYTEIIKYTKEKGYKLDILITYLNSSQTDEINQQIKVFLNTFDTTLANDNIERLKEIANYIKANNYSYEESVKLFKLNEEQLLFVKLIHVIYFYTDSDYENGDKLLKEVEKNKRKTNKVVNFISEIKRNKNFYKDNNQQKTRKLIQ